MGLGFCNKDKHFPCSWSYGGFYEFRRRIALSMGLCLEIDRSNGYRFINTGWSAWTKDWLLFLTHSDYDGYLTASQCGRIAPKLKAIIETWEEKDYDYSQGLLLVEAMEYCKANKTKLIYC